MEGAAIAWLLLNGAYVVFILPRVHHHILNRPVLPFVAGTILPFLLLALLSFIPVKLAASGWQNSSGSVRELAAFVVAAALYVGIGFFLLGKEMRVIVTSSVHWPRWRRS